MSIDNAIASLAVKDLSAAVEWYQALLERAPDSRPMPEDLPHWTMFTAFGYRPGTTICGGSSRVRVIRSAARQ